MAELELTQTPDDRNLYALEPVGTLRLRGRLSKSATAEAGGRSWEVARRGVFTPVTEATDAAGTVVGAFRGRTLKRGGALTWAGREFALRPASMWRERYALVDGDRELAVLEGKGWGRRPVKVVVDDLGAIDPGLLLFAAFVVRGAAEDAATSASVTSSTAAS